MSLDLSVVISCYNEQESIVPTLNAVTSALQNTSINWEVLVVDDHSDDGSVKKIKQFIQSNLNLNVKLQAREINQGLVKTIFDAALQMEGDYFWCVAGDNPVTYETCLDLFSMVGKVDLIIPYVKNYVGRTLLRRILSSLYALLVRLISGCPIRYYNGSSIFLRKQFLEQMENIHGFTYSAEMIISLIDRGSTYIEVPVIYNDRTHGSSTAVTYSNFLDTFWFFGRMLQKRFSRTRLIKSKQCVEDL